MAVSKRLRFEIFRRDNNTCRYCGQSAPDVELTIDHVIPRTLGGSDDPTNLVTACKDCNAGKTSSNPDAPVVADVDQRAVQWSQAMEIAVSRRQAELQQDRERTVPFDTAWQQWHDIDGEPLHRDGNWRATILRLLASGLDDAFLVDAVQIAMGSKVKAGDTWRYFCGVCWREIDRIVEIASEVASAQAPAAVAAPVTAGAEEEWDASAFAQEIFVERNPSDAVSVTANPDDIEPMGKYAYRIHPDFPVLNLAERFALRLVETLGAGPDVRAQVEMGLWDAMQAAYYEFFEGPIDGAGLADRRVTVAFDKAIEDTLLRIRIAVDHGSRV